MTLPFGTVPSAAKAAPSPFKVSVPEEQISEFQTLVKLSKVAPQTYEGSHTDRRFGITTEWLVAAKEKWVTDFNWRACETRINSFPQFTYEIEGLTVHFVALLSEKVDAVPIVLLHGWPSNFLEFLPLLSLLREEYTPSALPFHVIVPSFPGYTFSSGPPLDKDFGVEDISRIINQLMVNLGFEDGYVAQGGDIGSMVARMLAVDYESCKAVHLNVSSMRQPSNVSDASSLTEIGPKALARLTSFRTMGIGYAIEQATRPSTIGHILSTNPVALLAWVGEKFLEWADDPLPLETILESVSLYWFTETYPRALYAYRQYPELSTHGSSFHYGPEMVYPQAFRILLLSCGASSRAKSWVETTGTLVFFRKHEKGGHFAALERPEDMKSDLVDFVRQVWPQG